MLERQRFDVLVIAGWSLMATQLAIVWARTRRVPYLIVADNHLQEARPAYARFLKSLVLRYVVPQAAGYLVPGTLSREHALYYGARPETIAIFPNTIDVAGYKASAERLRARRDEIRRGLGIAADAVVIAYVGRLLPGKGVRDVVEATARASRLTAMGLHLLLVGDGPLREELQQHVAEFALPATFAGFREGEGILECYAAADAFALLSHRETWGVVVNEAAAFGLPLVLTDAVGAGADLLRPGENGELVGVGDVEAAARALAKLAGDAELRGSYGRRSGDLVAPWGYESGAGVFVDSVSRALASAGKEAR
jgi:glycosyltransferase involved in cell wall biosynthesis